MSNSTDRLRTSLHAFIARWSAATLDPVREVTLDPGRFVHQPVRTDVVGGAAPLAVPVLDTAVGVRIPTARLAGAVQIMAAVHYGSLGGSDTVVTTGIADWPADQVCIISHLSSQTVLTYLSPQSVYFSKLQPSGKQIMKL